MAVTAGAWDTWLHRILLALRKGLKWKPQGPPQLSLRIANPQILKVSQPQTVLPAEDQVFTYEGHFHRNRIIISIAKNRAT